MADETGPDAFIRQQQAIMGRVDSRPGLGAIDRPTLVLVGDSDQLTPPELSAEIAGSIPGARLVVVAGAGHLSTLDQPDQVTRALVAWLQARAPGPSPSATPRWGPVGLEAVGSNLAQATTTRDGVDPDHRELAAAPVGGGGADHHQGQADRGDGDEDGGHPGQRRQRPQRPEDLQGSDRSARRGRRRPRPSPWWWATDQHRC